MFWKITQYLRQQNREFEFNKWVYHEYMTVPLWNVQKVGSFIQKYRSVLFDNILGENEPVIFAWWQNS